MAAVFDSLSENLGGFREKIQEGAFDDVMKDDVRVLRDHEPSMILGRTTKGTAKIEIKDKGLFYSWDDPDTTYSRDLAKSMGRGDIDQSSFGFIVDEDKWNEDDEGRVVRTIIKVRELFDVSPVTFPAYPDTSVAKRSMNQFKEEQKKPEPTEAEVEHEYYKRKIKLQKQKNGQD